MKLVIVIPADTGQAIRTHEVAKAPPLQTLQDYVDGYIESVPHWNDCMGMRCVVYANEEGKLRHLPVNVRATALWYEKLGQRRTGRRRRPGRQPAEGQEGGEAMTAQRECGGCTQCCKVIAVTELQKPQGKWCQHCQIGKGCAIQGSADRPQSCSDFNCLWLQGFGTEEMRPDRSKVVMASTRDAKSVVLHVDPSRPDAYRAPAFDRLITGVTENGRPVFVVTGDKRVMIRSAQPGETINKLELNHGN